MPDTERQDVGTAEVEAALDAAMATTFPAFNAEALAAYRAHRKPAPHAVVEALGANAGEAPNEIEVELAEAEGLSAEELRLRRNLSPAGARTVDELQKHCPAALQVYYTGNNNLRVALASGRETVLLILTTSHGRLCVTTRASAEVCQSLGLEAGPITGNIMNTHFYIDPAERTSGMLLTVAGAAAEAVAGRPQRSTQQAQAAVIPNSSPARDGHLRSK